MKISKKYMKPRIVLHDVCQTVFLSSSQIKAINSMSLFDWFKKAMNLLDNQKVKLAVVAEGLSQETKWVQFIKDNKLEVQCHGMWHIEMHKFDYKRIYEDLVLAKGIIENTFDQKITEFHPPKLKVCPAMYEVCKDLQMNLVLARWRPDHLLQGINVPEVYIHYWSQRHLNQIREVLIRQQSPEKL